MSSSQVNFVGIINQGSTCYLNTVLQSLFHLPKFRNFVFQLKTNDEDSVAYALKEIFAQLQARTSNISTVRLTDAFGWKGAEAAVQHDVHEMVQQLFDSLESSLKGTPQENFIRDNFCGKIVYRSVATDGVNYVSDRLEEFYDVELVVKDKNNITESLKALTEPEKIEGVSIEVPPSTTPSKHNIERSQKFVELPPVLLIHPNRVAFDTKIFDLVTLSNRWSFDDALDLADYLIDANSLKLDKESLAKFKNKIKPSRSGKYRLHSILTHAGTATIGHYYAYIQFDGQWISFDDEDVTPAKEEDVKRSAFGGQPAQNKYRLFENERASLLVFVKDDCAQDILKEVPCDPSIISMAQQIEKRQIMEQNTTEYSFFFCDNALADVIDGVPGAYEKYLHKVRCPSDSTTEEILSIFAKTLGEPDKSIGVVPNDNNNPFSVLNSLYYHRVSLVYKTALCKSKPVFFALVRRVSEKLTLEKATLVFSREDLLKHYVSGDRGYLCTSYCKTPVMMISALDEIPCGGNVIFSNLAIESVTKLYKSRQYRETTFYAVDSMHQVVPKLSFALLLDEDTTYTQLQAHVYSQLKRKSSSIPQIEKLGKDAIIFFSSASREGGNAEYPSFYPTWPSSTNYGREITLRVFHQYSRTVFFGFLSVPLPTVTSDVNLVFNIGWCKQARIFLTKQQEVTTLSLPNLLKEAYHQVDNDIPENLKTALTKSISTSNAANGFKLFLVDEGIPKKVMSGNDEIRFSDYSKELRYLRNPSWVLDIVPALLDGYQHVDVYYCNRRSGENYFGYPITILTTIDMGEKGEDILKRVFKRLYVPKDKEEVFLKKWMVSVKNLESGKVQSLGRTDTLSETVKAIEGKKNINFCILIDRPSMVELDGHEDAKRHNDAIVINKNTSKEDLSAL